MTLYEAYVVFVVNLRGGGKKTSFRYPSTFYVAATLYIRTLLRLLKLLFCPTSMATNSHNPRALFKMFNSAIKSCPDKLDFASPALCEQFLNYFTRKISLLKTSLPHLPVVNPLPGGSPSNFCQCEPISLSTFKSIIDQLRSSNSAHDFLPSRILKDGFDVHFLLLINLSLLTGRVPAAFKHAVVQPVLKKTSLDHTDRVNYRPISKLHLDFI